MNLFFCENPVKTMTDKNLLLYWEYLWEYQEKVFSKVIEFENKIIELEIIEKKMEKDLHSSQDIGQLVGEVVKKIGSNRYILKAPTGTRYIVSAQNAVNKDKIKQSNLQQKKII